MRLAVTRTMEQVSGLAQKAALRGIEIVALPVVEVRPVGFDFPDDISPDSVDWLVFTSANAVGFFFERIETLGVNFSAVVKIAAIGQATVNAVEARKLRVDFVPSEAYGKTLFNEFIQSLADETVTVMYVSARTVNYDPADLFAETDLRFIRLVCYDTVVNEAVKENAIALEAGDVILFTSPSSVSAYDKLFGKPVPRVLAIGNTTAAKMAEHHWPRPVVMDKPDVEQVLEYI